MSGVPLDFLFQPRARDFAGNLWGVRYTGISRTANSTALQVGGTSPEPWPNVGDEFIEWVKNIRVVGIPGAGQNVTRIDLSVTDTAGNALCALDLRTDAGAADAWHSLTIQPGDLPLVGGRHALRAQVNFNASVATNTANLHVSSVITIKGNVSLF